MTWSAPFTGKKIVITRKYSCNVCGKAHFASAEILDGLPENMQTIRDHLGKVSLHVEVEAHLRAMLKNDFQKKHPGRMFDPMRVI